MGRDKALLPFRGSTLAAHVASLVQAAAGNVALVGDPAKYRALGIPVLADSRPGTGPLGGIETALGATSADWNLVVACDMPALTISFLRALLDAAGVNGEDALVPVGPSGRPEPLCGVYHRRCRPALDAALESGVRRITEALQRLRVTLYDVASSAFFENLNTPEDWAGYHDAH